VLAPVELGPYNRHAGYHYGPNDEGAFILGNRHIVDLKNGTLVLRQHDAQSLLGGFKDFIIHELTHTRQAQLEREHGWQRKRGDHRDLGWYTAVAEACPRYLGVEVPRSAWPTGPRSRADQGKLTEVEMTHWPTSLRWLAEANDSRLPRAAAHQLVCTQPHTSAHDAAPAEGA
jgi:hypothetical protein